MTSAVLPSSEPHNSHRRKKTTCNRNSQSIKCSPKVERPLGQPKAALALDNVVAKHNGSEGQMRSTNHPAKPAFDNWSRCSAGTRHQSQHPRASARCRNRGAQKRRKWPFDLCGIRLTSRQKRGLPIRVISHRPGSATVPRIPFLGSGVTHPPGGSRFQVSDRMAVRPHRRVW